MRSSLTPRNAKLMINMASTSSFAAAHHRQKLLLMAVHIVAAYPAGLEASEGCLEVVDLSISAQVVAVVDSSLATQIASSLSSYGRVVVEALEETIWRIFLPSLEEVAVVAAAVGQLDSGLDPSR